MTAIERAKQLLKEGAALAVVNGGREKVFCERGVKSLTRLADEDRDFLNGAAAADKIAGKAAALLMAAGGVKEVYAEVMSGSAAETFARFKIKYSYDTYADVIMNRTGTAPCPMEQTVKYISDPGEAEAAIRRTQKVLAVQNHGGKAMKKLGFGMMRLPVIDGNQGEIDLEQVK